MPTIQVVRHQVELEGLLGRLEEERPDWDALIRHASAFVRGVERLNLQQPFLQIVQQMEHVMRTRDKQRARLWVESTMRVLERVSNQMQPWPLRAAAAVR